MFSILLLTNNFHFHHHMCSYKENRSSILTLDFNKILSSSDSKVKCYFKLCYVTSKCQLLKCLKAKLQTLRRVNLIQVGIKYPRGQLIRIVLIGNSQGRVPAFYSQDRNQGDNQLDSIFLLLFLNCVK